MRVVVCGAGTAGCVVAARLSQDPGVEVVLLEVGPHYRPGRWPAALAHSHRIIKETHDWGYLARAGASPRIVHVPRGRVVGGSSVTNGAIALRGHPEHYDEWDALVDGFGWETWLPWFRAIETDRDFGDADWHGDHGPIPISRYPRGGWMELQERFAEAALAAGHAWVDDHNAPGAVGIGPIPLNMVDGVRQTPADHYLDPALARPNLRLRAGVTVDRVVLEGGVAGVDTPRRGRVGGADPYPRRTRWSCARHLADSPPRPAALGGRPPRRARAHGSRSGGVAGVGGAMPATRSGLWYRFELALDAPAWPAPWYQCLLTGAHEVGGEAARLPGDAVLGDGGGRPALHGPERPGRRRPQRRGHVRLQGRDPRLQPRIEMGWFWSRRTGRRRWRREGG